jgi:integrase/recombinase XerD
MLFKEVTERFLEHMANIDRSQRTISIYKRDLNTIRKFLEDLKNGPVYIEDVCIDDLEAFMRYAKEVKNYAANTKSNYFYVIRSLYSYAYKKEIIERNISLSMDFMKMPRKERNYLSEKEVETIIKNIDNRLIKLIAAFLFNTGTRISECLNLKIDDVNFDNKTIIIIEGKGRKDRIIPMNEKLQDMLFDYKENWREGHGTDRFFSTKKTGKISYSHVNSTIKKAAKAAGISKEVSCHVFRHSFAAALVKNNVGLVQIQKLLGHESLAVTSIYTHTNLKALSEAVNTLSN